MGKTGSWELIYQRVLTLGEGGWEEGHLYTNLQSNIIFIGDRQQIQSPQHGRTETLSLVYLMIMLADISKYDSYSGLTRAAQLCARMNKEVELYFYIPKMYFNMIGFLALVNI